MTDDIEELKKMHDILTGKLRYYEKTKDKGLITGLKKNINKVSERIKELEN